MFFLIFFHSLFSFFFPVVVAASYSSDQESIVLPLWLSDVVYKVKFCLGFGTERSYPNAVYVFRLAFRNLLASLFY